MRPGIKCAHKGGMRKNVLFEEEKSEWGLLIKMIIEWCLKIAREARGIEGKLWGLASLWFTLDGLWLKL